MTLPRTNRYPYIDALRGLAIIIVVFGHVETYGFFNFQGITVIENFFQAIQMPLFFFISGFVAYKALPVTSLNKLSELLKRKALQLLVPAFVVGLIYTYIKSGSDFTIFISDAAKKGYWFTISLFEMMFVYYVISYVANRNGKDGLWCLLAVSLICFMLKLPFKSHPLLNQIGNYSSLHFTFSHFQFLALGLLARKYSDNFEGSYDSQPVRTAAVIAFFIFFGLQLYLYKDGNLSGLVGKVIETLAEVAIAYPTVYLLFFLFSRYYNSSFMNGTLEYVGKRTWDIYLLHYFFLPKLPMVGDFLKMYPNVVLECFMGFTIAIAVVTAALIISRIINTSSFLGKVVLGSNNIVK